MKPLPKLIKEPVPRLIVDGEPFLILGLQWDCNSTYTEVEMNPLFAEAKKMGCNTAVTPLYWESIEPEEGKFDFTTLDNRIKACEKNGLKLILLWFASYKNAGCYYAPRYIRENHEKYQKVVVTDGSLQDKTLCPNDDDALEKDKRAFRELFKHLRDFDQERTVITVQCENETGILGSARCHCPKCNELFEQGDWEEKYGAEADEAFAAYSLARYVDQVTVAGKEEYNILVYTNAALGGAPGSRPGLDYFSAGPIQKWLPIWQEAGPNIDFLAPDIYTPSYPKFNRICEEFKANGNPLYIAETSTDPLGRTEKNVFYAIGKHGAIGFDPWAIDRSFVDWFSTPLVRRYDLKWSERAWDLKDSYTAIGRAVKQIASAVGTERIRTFVQEEGDRGEYFSLAGYDWKITYPKADGKSRGMVIDLENGEFLISGVNLLVQSVTPSPEGKSFKIDEVERGHFEGDEWICHARVVQENARGQRPIRVEEGQVVKFRIDR